MDRGPFALGNGHEGSIAVHFRNLLVSVKHSSKQVKKHNGFNGTIMQILNCNSGAPHHLVDSNCNSKTFKKSFTVAISYQIIVTRMIYNAAHAICSGSINFFWGLVGAYGRFLTTTGHLLKAP